MLGVRKHTLPRSRRPRRSCETVARTRSRIEEQQVDVVPDRSAWRRRAATGPTPLPSCRYPRLPRSTVGGGGGARYLSLASSAGCVVTPSVTRFTWIPEVVGRSSLCERARIVVFFVVVVCVCVCVVSAKISVFVCVVCLRVCHVIVVVPFSENWFWTPKSSSPVNNDSRSEKYEKTSGKFHDDTATLSG